jgi:endonuclease G
MSVPLRTYEDKETIMLLPERVVSDSERRLGDFDPRQRQSEIEGKSPIEVNSPERVTEWIATAAPAQLRIEGVGLERIINGNDLMPINYLDRGVDAAKSVGRISVVNANGQTIGFGTGFMVSPRLLLTNNHVFPNAQTAAKSFIRFNYQLDREGTKTVGDDFDLDPQTCFITNTRLDFSIVAVKEKSGTGAPLSSYGFVRLDARPGKTLDAQFLTIIQHPSGERKQIAIRENQLIKTMDDFLWYVTDTAPGSSGSFVANDSWQVVALHHSGVPAKDDQGRILTIDGAIADASTDDSKIKWVANEGVRISSILAELRNFASVPLVKQLLDSVTGTPQAESTLVGVSTGPNTAGARDTMVLALSSERISIDPNYDNRHGYDPAFLGTSDKRVPLPKLSTHQIQLVPDKLVDDNHPAHVLAYHHYSVVMNKVRRLPFFTAVNIDGSVSFRLKRDPDNWKFDPRIPKAAQVGEELYTNNDFDRGHLVRRLDPAWGENQSIARVANDDTFHFTNCSPQHKTFNQGQALWAGLEDYILDNADTGNFRVTVFTGPVFRDDDTLYRELIPIPKDFWKVVVMAKNSGLSATAYVVSQKTLIQGIEEAFTFGQYRTFQVPVKKIATLTGLDFGSLVAADPLAVGGLHEAVSAGARLIESYNQIAL